MARHTCPCCRRLSGTQLAALLAYCTSDLLDDYDVTVEELAGVPVLLGDGSVVQLALARTSRQQVFMLDDLEQRLVPGQSGLLLATQHLPPDLAARLVCMLLGTGMHR